MLFKKIALIIVITSTSKKKKKRESTSWKKAVYFGCKSLYLGILYVTYSTARYRFLVQSL